MAKILFTAFMADARGKLAGTVFSKNKGGSYVRTKVTPVNPQSSDQMLVRSRLAVNSTGWRGLTDGQRAQWSEYAATRPRPDIFGTPKVLTGQQFYMSSNQNLASINLPAIDTPIAPPGYPASILESFEWQASGTMDFNLDVPQGAGWAMVVQATTPVSAGRMFLKNLYREIAVAPVGTGTGPVAYNIVADYVAKFGALDNAEGFRIGIRIKFISPTSGEATPWQEISATAS